MNYSCLHKYDYLETERVCRMMIMGCTVFTVRCVDGSDSRTEEK